MEKLSVVEAAESLGVSKEAVYNRIRRNTLQTVIENGTKYVLLKEDKTQDSKTPKKTRAKQSVSIDKYIELLLEQIDELKEANRELQKDKERLIKEKEALLINAKDEMENIYKEKDEQLKSVLAIVTRPLITYMKSQRQAIDATFEDLTPYERGLIIDKPVDKWINLEVYMDEKGYSSKKKKNINTQLVGQTESNKNIKEENGVLFIRRGKKIKDILGKKL